MSNSKKTTKLDFDTVAAHMREQGIDMPARTPPPPPPKKKPEVEIIDVDKEITRLEAELRATKDVANQLADDVVSLKKSERMKTLELYETRGELEETQARLVICSRNNCRAEAQNDILKREIKRLRQIPRRIIQEVKSMVGDNQVGRQVLYEVAKRWSALVRKPKAKHED